MTVEDLRNALATAEVKSCLLSEQCNELHAEKDEGMMGWERKQVLNCKPLVTEGCTHLLLIWNYRPAIHSC